MKNAIAIALAVAAVGVLVYVVVTRTRIAAPKIREDSTHWAMLSMAGFYQCPHCKKKVTLTKEQLATKDPPALACPHCKKPVDIVHIMTGKPRTSAAPQRSP